MALDPWLGTQMVGSCDTGRCHPSRPMPQVVSTYCSQNLAFSWQMRVSFGGSLGHCPRVDRLSNARESFWGWYVFRKLDAAETNWGKL